MIGNILRQSYKIIEQLGDGGFGETYLAERLINIPVTPKPKCVVKRLKPQRKDDPDMVRRFKKEAAILEKLGNNHDKVPKLIDYFEENRDFYLVQEHIDGHDLNNEITHGNPWSEAEVIELLQEILEVLAFVHQQGVIHRDIKPSNLMRRYSDGKLMLIDFGIFKQVSTQVVDSQGQMSSSTTSGTLGYMPSEQFSGHPKLCSDVYAVGMVSIQALTGVLPQQLPKDPNKLEVIWRDRAQVSDGLADILNKMVRHDFRQRYADATEALQALTQAVVTPPPRPSPSPQPSLPPVLPLVPVRIGDKYGYIDQTGQAIVQPQFDAVYEFSEGLAKVEIDDKYGYIDQTGQVVIKPQFDDAYKFSEGLAKVKIDDWQWSKLT